MNTDKLFGLMREKKIRVGEMCDKLEISKSAFYRKTRGTSEFTLREIKKICDILELDSPVGIFFAEKVS